MFGGVDVLSSYTGAYMEGLANFVKSWFPMFMFGAIFGKIMDVTGAAESVASEMVKLIGKKRAMLGVVLACALLTYGGVSLFVVVFAIYPVALSLFRQANLPRRLIPGCIALGAFTFTMTAFPGSPQLNNLIPTEYFGTNAMSGSLMGIVAGLVMLVGGYLYLLWREKKLLAAGEHFDEPQDHVKTVPDNLPNPWLSTLPLIAVVVTLNVFKFHIITALLCGIILAVALNWRQWNHMLQAVSDGAHSSVAAIMNTSAAVGFGAVVKVVPGFAVLTNLVLGIKGSPLVSEALAVTLLAGATGSSSGGMGIALEALGTQYVELAHQYGISLDAFHRVASIASGGLDSLPHCGAVITLLAVTGMKHKDSYGDIGVVTCVIPLIATAVAVLMGSVGLV